MSVGAWKQSPGGVLEEDGRWSDITGWDPGEPVGVKNHWLWNGRDRSIYVYVWNVDFSLSY